MRLNALSQPKHGAKDIFAVLYGLARIAGRAIDIVQKNYGEPVTGSNIFNILVLTAPPMVWSVIHGTAIFPYIPSERRREFLDRTAKSL